MACLSFRWLIAGLLVCLFAGAAGGCSGKLGRVTMNLRPDTRAVVLVEGDRPTVSIVNTGPAVPTLHIEMRAAEREGEWSVDLAPSGGTYQAELPGSARFTITNRSPEATLVELKAVRYREIVVERSPFPFSEVSPDDVPPGIEP